VAGKKKHQLHGAVADFNDGYEQKFERADKAKDKEGTIGSEEQQQFKSLRRNRVVDRQWLLKTINKCEGATRSLTPKGDIV
jgi:hypothetical protein